MKWPRKRSVAFFVLDGPESLLSSDDPSGHRGWLDQLASLRVVQLPPTRAFSWILYRIANEVAEFSDLPRYVLRHCVWDSQGDKENDDEEVRISVRYYNFPEDALPNWRAVAERIFDALLDARRQGQRSPRGTCSLRRYSIDLTGFEGAELSHASYGDPDHLDEDWARITSFAVESAVVEGLAESYHLPLVNECFPGPVDGRYGEFLQFFLDREEEEDDSNVDANDE